MRITLQVIAWLLLIGLVFVTLSPINLRPISPLPTQLERAMALAIVGFAFAIAYPRHIVLVAVLVLGSTILLEVLQIASPSRHGRLIDAGVKLVGGGFGLLCGWFVMQIRQRRQNI
jgi:VanZ family protein